MRRAILTLLVGGCGKMPQAEPPDLAVPPPLCDDATIGTDAAVPPTFANMQHLFDAHCTTCHCGQDVYLHLCNGAAYGELVRRPTSMDDQTVDESCGGVLVVPGDAGVSYLYQKVSMSMPCAGDQMPRGEFGSIPIPDCEQDLVRRWIAAGAPQP
jgi:hypothetical protein